MFDGLEIIFRVGRKNYRFNFSGISGKDFIVQNEIYQIIRGGLDEVLFDFDNRIKTLEVHVPSNFIRIVDGKLDCADQFVELIRGASDDLIRDIKFFAQILQFGVNDGTLVYIGLVDTSIATLDDGQLMNIQTIPIGFSHLVNDLMVVKKISSETAIDILNQAVITLEADQRESYDAGGKHFAVREINDIVKSRIEELGEEIIDYIRAKPISLAGRDFESVHGARNYLAQIIGMNIKSCQS